MPPSSEADGFQTILSVLILRRVYGLPALPSVDGLGTGDAYCPFTADAWVDSSIHHASIVCLSSKQSFEVAILNREPDLDHPDRHGCYSMWSLEQGNAVQLGVAH